MRNEEFKWRNKKCRIKSINYRTRITDSGEEQPYLSMKVESMDDFDSVTFSKIKAKRKRKDINVMCFRSNLFESFSEGEIYDLSGFISFGYGNTYLVIKTVKAFKKDPETVSGVFDDIPF